MGSCFVDEINKRDVITASAGGPGADEVLIAAAKDGDKQAFGVLIEHHHRRILALALRYVRVREDAEDIVQQTAAPLALRSVWRRTSGFALPFLLWSLDDRIHDRKCSLATWEEYMSP